MLTLEVPSTPSSGHSSLSTELYNPKTFIVHAALLRQTFVHCAIFLTAASRRSLGRISVPVWPVILSDRLLIVALVGRYPANKLIRRGIISKRIATLTTEPCGSVALCGIRRPFERLFPIPRQISHVLRTRSPLTLLLMPVRLACIKHAASVRPEPGSNSPLLNEFKTVVRSRFTQSLNCLL